MKKMTHTMHKPSASNGGRLRPQNWRLLLALPLFVAAAFTAPAQSFSIGWFKIAGGGSTSAGGTFALRGTIGQPDASAPLTSGQFALRGGFWTLPAPVQVIGSPTLVITPAGSGAAIISWSPATPGFILQETASLTAPTWANSPSGSVNPVTVYTASPMKFYRLVRP
jgi:hypothetical protein